MPVVRGPRTAVALALVSASVVSAPPATAAQTDVRVSSRAVNLTADGSFLNVTHNLVNAVLNAPMAHLEGIQRFTAAMEESASWWVYSPTNVLGWDPANPEMVKGIVDTFAPFKALSTPVGYALNAWFAANLPMNVGCTGIPPCPDFAGMLESMFTVSWLDLYTVGHTFNELPYSHNPVSADEGYWSQELGQIGEPVDWYGQTVKLNIMDIPNSIKAYLTGTPEPVRIPTLRDAVQTYSRLAKALWDSFYPWVPTSLLWNPEYSPSAYLTRPIAPLLCPKCNPYDPYMPVDWEPGDPTAPGGYVPKVKTVAAPSAATPSVETVSAADDGVPGAEPVDAADEQTPPSALSLQDRITVSAATAPRANRRAVATQSPSPAAAVTPAGDDKSTESPRKAKRGGHTARAGAAAGSGK